MSQIKSVGIAVPEYRHDQQEILRFMSRIYAFNEKDRRALRYLYHHSGIQTRYSAIPDYSREPSGWTFYPPDENLEPFPSLEKRMDLYSQWAAPLSISAIQDCFKDQGDIHDITHLITVSCTGMSAPGLDLQLLEMLGLPKNTFRTSVNFMGCYAAIHALKMADAFCCRDSAARVLIVCTELCTLHFQQQATTDNITSSLIFGDGSAAALVTGDRDRGKGMPILAFYGEVSPQGKSDMSWTLTSTGFAMTLSSFVPALIEEDFDKLVEHSLERWGMKREEITHWAIHPGGKKILEAVAKSLALQNGELDASVRVLHDYGNMSSPSLLFILKQLMKDLRGHPGGKIFSAAFGPGLTMESFIAGTPT